MIGVAANRIDSSAGSASAPAESTIDVDHLARMTLGDRSLEREVLHLFDIQTGMLIDRMRNGPASGIGCCAHTLKGSARGIGAWRIAHAAEQVELSATIADPSLDAAIEGLVHAVDATRSAIAGLLQFN